MSDIYPNLGSTISNIGKMKIAIAPTQIMGAADTIVDWSQYNIFKKSITATTTLTFLNNYNGISIIILIVNSSGATRTLNLPSGIKWGGGVPITSIANNTSVLYSLVQIDGAIYCSAVDSIV